MIMKYLKAALSLWEGADDPQTKTVYVRAQAETFGRLLQDEGFDVPTGEFYNVFMLLARRVAAGESIEFVSSSFFLSYSRNAAHWPG